HRSSGPARAANTGNEQDRHDSSLRPQLCEPVYPEPDALDNERCELASDTRRAIHRYADPQELQFARSQHAQLPDQWSERSLRLGACGKGFIVAESDVPRY